MAKKAKPSPAALPSVERLVGDAALAPFCEAFGRPFVTDTAREVIAEARARLLAGKDIVTDADALAVQVGAHIETLMAPSLVPVFNLSGTVLHTNLGRAPLPPEAVAAMAAVPDLERALLLDVVADNWLQGAEQVGARAIHCGHRQLSESRGGEVLAAGYNLRCFTVNDGIRAKTLLDWGVQGIITDYPERVP